MGKAGIVVCDKFFGSQVVSNTTTLLTQNIREQIDSGSIGKISQDHWWSGECLGKD